MNTVMMYAMKRSSFLKKRTLPSHAMPITTVSDNDDFIQYLKMIIREYVHVHVYALT